MRMNLYESSWQGVRGSIARAEVRSQKAEVGGVKDEMRGKGRIV